VLSGFLITTTLCKERASLEAFYVKRFFRLLPAAWLYLLLLPAAGALLGIPLLNKQEALSCLLFFRNFRGQMNKGMTAHSWSLSLEEQFYAFWPPVLISLGRRPAKWIAGARAVVISFYRLTHWANYDRMYASFRSEARTDALLIGSVVALPLVDPDSRHIERWAKPYGSSNPRHHILHPVRLSGAHLRVGFREVNYKVPSN
jgi:peptidoglycan/LPS O-acetylase OafA/YrhL